MLHCIVVIHIKTSWRITSDQLPEEENAHFWVASEFNKHAGPT
jgi:hypothetical protein